VVYARTTLVDGRIIPPVNWHWHQQRCPECYELIVMLEQNKEGDPIKKYLGYPAGQIVPREVPLEVTDPYRQDFQEACLVLPISPKASAAISRRCIQAVLREKAQTKSKDLNDQINLGFEGA
jgi:hypothetical protein